MKIKLATQEQLENVKSEILENTDSKIKEEIDKIPPINNATDISTGVVKVDKTEDEEAPHTVPTIGRLEEDMSAFGDKITADIQSFKDTTVSENNALKEEITNSVDTKMTEVDSKIIEVNSKIVEAGTKINSKLDTSALTFVEGGKTYLAKFAVENGIPKIIANEVI